MRFVPLVHALLPCLLLLLTRQWEFTPRELALALVFASLIVAFVCRGGDVEEESEGAAELPLNGEGAQAQELRRAESKLTLAFSFAQEGWKDAEERLERALQVISLQATGLRELEAQVARQQRQLQVQQQQRLGDPPPSPQAPLPHTPLKRALPAPAAPSYYHPPRSEQAYIVSTAVSPRVPALQSWAAAPKSTLNAGLPPPPCNKTCGACCFGEPHTFSHVAAAGTSAGARGAKLKQGILNITAPPK